MDVNLAPRTDPQVVGNNLSDPLVEDPTSEVFVSGLKQLHSPTAVLAGPEFPTVGASPVAETQSGQRQAYEYYHLDSDTSSKNKIPFLI